MMREYANHWIELGEEIADAAVIWSLDENFNIKNLATGDRRLNKRGEGELAGELARLLSVAKKLDLPVSQKLLGRRLKYANNLPQTRAEFEVLVEALKDEIATKLFLFVPSYRASYYENHGLSPSASAEFPKAADEVRQAGNCYAFGLATAAVFHAMRAVEIGVRVLGKELGVAFSYPIELAEWGKIIGEIEPKIEALKAGQRSAQKDADLKFYSEAASQFRHFNNGWRIRVSHARENYTEDQAREVIDHVRSFFETLATRLKE